MYKIASIALTAALGIAGMAKSMPAEAHPYVGVGVGVPGVVVVEPGLRPVVAPGFVPAYYGYGPYRYGRGPYWRPGFGRYDHGRFYRHWNRC